MLDLRAGEPVRRSVVGHDDVVLSVTYSADGKRLLTSGPDSRVGLWHGETGRLLARVVVPTRYTVPAFRTEEDSVLIAPLGGGPVLEWDTRVEDAVDFTCAVAGRDLTEAEWTEQFGDQPYQQVCPSWSLGSVDGRLRFEMEQPPVRRRVRKSGNLSAARSPRKVDASASTPGSSPAGFDRFVGHLVPAP